MAEVVCDTDIVEAPDIACEESYTELIGKIYFAIPGKPIVLLAKNPQNETNDAQLARTILGRLAETDEDQMMVLKVYKGTMPAATPAYKINPHNNTQLLSEADTDMRIEGVDYRSNQENYDFWKAISNGKTYLVWWQTGKYFFGGLTGVLANFQATSAIIDDGNVAHRINWQITWKGNPMPDRRLIAA